MNVILLHDRIAPDARADELDVLAQVEAVTAALRELRHTARPMAFSLDLPRIIAALQDQRPDCVFNLVESVEGHGRLIDLAPAVLDTLHIPYTGSSTNAMFLTSNKLLAKQWLLANRLPTPEWRTNLRSQDVIRPGRYIIKSVWEHASIGLDDGAVVDARSADDLRRVITERAPRLGGEAFAEDYIDGREFNLSLLAGAQGPRVLPPAEVVFDDFLVGRPRIVDYRAKWVEGSFEYTHTPQRFDFGPADAPLLDELGDLARRCWRVFDLRGYARVDFRVDAEGRPFILEINANPCLSPDAGFAAALQRAGVAFADAVRLILQDARRSFDR